MPMDGQHCPGLDGVQHPLGLVGRAVPQVQVHPKARRLLGLGGQGVKNMMVDYHINTVASL